ncbi:type 1 glutamine amidotransferase domain-containing protein [Convivina intestini]|nr:type 1 glutamine amidotransferase domain-containing protein [Convivina intestini]
MTKKILIVLTNMPTYGQADDATGLWLGEATEFIDEFRDSDVTFDYVSPHGGYVPVDPRSLKFADENIFGYYRSSDFQNRALRNSKRPAEINPADYVAIYYTGGHGVMWDFPHDNGLAQIAQTIYQQGGYLSSVCHGIAGLFFLQNDQGHPLIAGKKITGFTTTEEYLSGKFKKIPFWNEKVAQEQGASFKKARAYKPFAIQDGRIITGQNPFSPRQTARLLRAAIQ